MSTSRYGNTKNRRNMRTMGRGMPGGPDCKLKRRIGPACSGGNSIAVIFSVVWAATATFVAAGVDVPVRDIAARAGVGVATIYRHFPTRADLIAAVYRHQVEACALAGPTLLNDSSSPLAALTDWIDLFIDFLITKRGLASALQSDSAAFETLHAYFLDRLVPVCAELLDAAAAAAEIVPDVDAYGLMRGIGNLCIGADTDPDYDPRRMVQLVIAGLRPK